MFFLHYAAVAGANMQTVHDLYLVQHRRVQGIPKSVKFRIGIAVEDGIDKQVIPEIIIKKSFQNDLHGVASSLSWV